MVFLIHFYDCLSSLLLPSAPLSAAVTETETAVANTAATTNAATKAFPTISPLLLFISTFTSFFFGKAFFFKERFFKAAAPQNFSDACSKSALLNSSFASARYFSLNSCEAF